MAGGYPGQADAGEPGNLQRAAEKGVRKIPADDADKGMAEDRGRAEEMQADWDICD